MFKEAIHWLQKALSKLKEEDEQWIVLKYDLGLLYKEIEDFEKALVTLKEVFNKKSNYRDVAKYIKDIENRLN